MTSKDFIESNLQMAAIAASLLNFYIIGTVAVLGWFLTSDAVISTPVLSNERIAIAVIYALLSVFSFLTHARFMARIRVGWTLAKRVASEDLQADPDFGEYVAHYNHYGTYIGIPAGTILIVFSLLWITIQ